MHCGPKAAFGKQVSQLLQQKGGSGPRQARVGKAGPLRTSAEHRDPDSTPRPILQGAGSHFTFRFRRTQVQVCLPPIAADLPKSPPLTVPMGKSRRQSWHQHHRHFHLLATVLGMGTSPGHRRAPCLRRLHSGRRAAVNRKNIRL